MGGKHKETGQYAYEAYANAVSPSAGYRVQWDELPEEIRDAWREAAHAVMRYGLRNGILLPGMPGLPPMTAPVPRTGPGSDRWTRQHPQSRTFRTRRPTIAPIAG